MAIKLQKKLLIMSKYAIFGILIQFVFYSFVFAEYSNAQRKSIEKIHVSIELNNLSIKEAFEKLEAVTDFEFAYKQKNVNSRQRLNFSKQSTSLANLLRRISKETNLGFKRVNEIIYVNKTKDEFTDGVLEYLSVAERTITGKVTDETGNGLPGVNVLVKNSDIGVITDVEGNYKLIVPDDASTLIFSYVGYITEEEEIGTRSTIDLQLAPDIETLSEIVVVGYGTVGKKDLTGSIATVSGEAIAERSVTNISNALQGAVSGVVVTRNSSEPGSGNTIRIRGNTTLQGSNDPLILVDDIPVSDINSVTPDMVESISILKDGAAAAIYGSRAAAGVIIITTKRAKKGVFKLDYRGEYFVNTPAKNREYVDGLTFMQLVNESRWNDTGNDPNGRFPIWSEDMINKYITGEAASNRDLYPESDWVGLMLNNQATGSRHNINISGGSEKISSNFFLGYEEQDAFYDFRKWRRYTTRINNDVKISDKIGVVADINFRLTQDDRPRTHSTVIEHALTTATVYPALWSDGRLATGRDNGSPYSQLLGGGNQNSDTYLFNAKLGAFYQPIDGLKIRLNVAPSVTFNKFKNFNKPSFVFDLDDVDMSNPIPVGNRINLTERRTLNSALLTQALLDYNKTFDKHTITALVGYEERSSQNETLGVVGQDFISPDFPFLNQAPTDGVFNELSDPNDPAKGTRISELAYASVFGRVDYNYDNKYFINGVLRRDGSSRFASDYRWGSFPSVSAAWTISNESFMESLRSKISYLKLKASYGSLGNDRLGNYLYLTQLQISNILLANGASVDEVRGLSQRFLTTPDITWETTVSKNIGLEFGLFRDKLSLEAEYFIKETKDMLLSLSVPDLVGFDDPTVNVGSMDTKGWDLNATWDDKVGNDFRYSISVNFSDARSIIGDINDKRLFDGITLSEEGYEFRELYGLQSDGLFQTQEDLDNSPVTNSSVSLGDVKYKDLSGPDGIPDSVINNFDRTFLGSSGPRHTFGGRINMEYKGFDLGIAFQGVGRSNFYLQRNLLNTSNVVRHTQEYADSYWSLDNTPEENLNVTYPRLSDNQSGNNYRFSDFWLRNGAYLKIKALSLGYTIPDRIIEKAGLSKARVYVTGNDLFSFHSLPEGIDPEQTSGFSYYITKSVVFGVNVNF